MPLTLLDKLRLHFHVDRFFFNTVGVVGFFFFKAEEEKNTSLPVLKIQVYVWTRPKCVHLPIA